MAKAKPKRLLQNQLIDLWAEENKFSLWLAVEKALVLAWAADGKIPEEAALSIADKANYTFSDIARYELSTHHDVTAFIQSVSDSLGDEARWFHYGVTSSDIVDTALALQMDRTIGLALEYMKGYEHRSNAKGRLISTATFGWVYSLLAHLADRIAVAQLSGPVGTHATLPHHIEEAVCKVLRLRTLAVSTQIVGRDIHADFTTQIALVCSVLARILDRPAYRDQALLARSCANTALYNIGLWHERDISHSSAERLVLPAAANALAVLLEGAWHERASR